MNITDAQMLDRPTSLVVSWPVALLLTLLLGTVFIYIPWELYSGQGFSDRDSYLATIDALTSSGATLFSFEGADILALFMNEFVWREILIFIGQHFTDPVDGLLLISLVAAMLMLWHVLRRAGVLYAVLFLLSPLAVDLFIATTRSALAMGVFMVAVTVRRSIFRYLLFALAFFLHTFAVVLVAIYFFNEILFARQQFTIRLKMLIALVFGMATSAVWAFLSYWIFTMVGDRRAVQDPILPASLKFALWWMVLTAALVFFANLDKEDKINAHFVALAVILQSMFVFTTIFNAGGVRFLSLSLPVVFIAVQSVPSLLVRAGLLTGTVIFSATYALYWIG